MAGKKQPGMIDMVSVLLEEMEKNKKSTSDLFVIVNKLNAKMERLQTYNPKLNTDSLRSDLEKMQKISDLHKSEIIKLVTNHIESCYKQKQEILEIKLPEKTNWYLDQKVWIIIFLCFYSLYISYLLYQLNTNVLSTLMELKTVILNFK